MDFLTICYTIADSYNLNYHYNMYQVGLFVKVVFKQVQATSNVTLLRGRAIFPN